MQEGERAVIELSIKKHIEEGKATHLVVLRIGLYTTIELTVDQALALHANLDRIRSAWHRQQLRAVDLAVTREDPPKSRTVLSSRGG